MSEGLRRDTSVRVLIFRVLIYKRYVGSMHVDGGLQRPVGIIIVYDLESKNSSTLMERCMGYLQKKKTIHNS